jgi:hypothetical protein
MSYIENLVDNHFSPGLVRDLVKAYRRNEDKAVLGGYIELLGKEMDAMDAKKKEKRDREEARKHPPLTTQKVIAVLRKAGLTIRSVPSGRMGVGGATGFDVAYGDWDLRTWVAVDYRFVWNWGYTQGIPKEQEVEAERKEHRKQMAAALVALQDAGFKVVRDPRDERGYKVTAS